MKVRIYCNNKLKLGEKFTAPVEKINYLQNVLKVKTGFSIFVFNEEDGEFEGQIILEKKNVLIKIIAFIKPLTEQKISKINLVFANIKNNLVSDILNSCTQIGVDNFFPITTKHTTNHHFSVSRGQKIIEEAVEQCERIKLPKLHEIQTFAQILTKISKDDILIFCDETANFTPFSNSIEENKSIFIFIGPEGGFTAEEREKLIQKNAHILSLNKFILRAETASICATFLINLITK